MATLILQSASPNALKYLFTAAGATEAAHKSKAELLADAQTATKGPAALVALLSETFTDNEWNALAKNPRVSIYCTITAAQAAGCMISPILTTLIGPEQRLTVNGIGMTAGDLAIIEFRFNPTPMQ